MHSSDGLGLHNHQVLMQRVPGRIIQPKAIHQRIDRCPFETNWDATHWRNPPPRAHQSEDLQGALVVWPDFYDDGFIVLKLKPLGARFGFCNRGLIERARGGSYRFDQAREKAGIPKAAFQFRDFRAKAATEADEAAGTKSAQALLGHTTEAMTANYIRHKAGRKVKPSK